MLETGGLYPTRSKTIKTRVFVWTRVAIELSCLGVPLVRILVIDDDPKIHLSIDHTLEGQGFSIAHAMDGRSALGILGPEPFDLVICDLVMPVKDGLSTLQTLRTQGFRMPVIVLSGYITEDLRRQIGYYRDTAVINKPFHPQELLGVVRQLTGVSPEGPYSGG